MIIKNIEKKLTKRLKRINKMTEFINKMDRISTEDHLIPDVEDLHIAVDCLKEALSYLILKPTPGQKPKPAVCGRVEDLLKKKKAAKKKKKAAA